MGGFFVKGWDVVAGLLHDFDDAVEADAVTAVRNGGVKIGVESTCGGISVALDAGNLDEAADRIAG